MSVISEIDFNNLVPGDIISGDVSSENNNTNFSTIYNRFLGKITDDMYMELTPMDTIRDLNSLLTDAIPGFEFPRCNIEDFSSETKIVNEEDLKSGDFILSIIVDENSNDSPRKFLVDRSNFNTQLSTEEINILALLMKQSWIERQVASIENIRMKYSGADFKMTSQANHLSKLLTLLEESRRDSFHMQRLYGRRKKDENGVYKSTWGSLSHHKHGRFV